MFSFVAFAALFLAVCADPTPTGPAPGTVFNEGSTCTVQWTADTSGSTTWKTMNIQLMTGDNFNMVPLSTVGTVDGTDPTKNVFSYPCLKVTPNSAIYFYQFSSPTSPNLYWTGRFVLAGPNGQSVPPANQKQPETGANIPWGAGKLVDPSQASAPPSFGGTTSPSATASLPGAPSANATDIALASNTVSSSSSLSTSVPSSSSSPSKIQTLQVPSASSSGSKTPSPTTNGAAAASSGAATGKDYTKSTVLTAIFSLFIASIC